jgi:IS5 family transposase
VLIDGRRTIVAAALDRSNLLAISRLNFLLGHDGDTVNALLVAAGHNLRLILAKLALWRAFIRAALTVLMAKSDTSPDRPTARRSMI